MNKNNYELNVLVNGKPVREYFQNGRFFIEAKNGTEYSLKLKNHSHKKIMAVVTVDGIDVLKGQKGTEAESGYIVNPFSSINIQGYRIDDNNVATFRFSDGKVSYATQVEQKFDTEELKKVERGEIAPAKNNGVIGVRIWEEKDPVLIPEWKPTPYRAPKSGFYGSNSNTINSFALSRGMPAFFTTGCFAVSGFVPNLSYNTRSFGSGGGNSMSAGPIRANYLSIESDSYEADSLSYGALEQVCSSYSSTESHVPEFNLGTSWGQQVEDKVSKVKFIKADTYIDLELFYLERDEMIKIGIDFEKTKKVFVSGFPKAFEADEYCKQPINWKGGK